MNNSPDALRYTYPIRKRKIVKRSFLNVIKALLASTVVSLLILGVIWVSVGGDEEQFVSKIELLKQPLLGIFGLLLLWIVWYPVYQYLYYYSYYYDVDEHNLFIRKGVTSKREITIPLSKITDVYLDQDIFDILLGLYDLHVSTPTTESLKFAHISGLNKAGATKIKSLILQNLKKSEIDSTEKNASLSSVEKKSVS